jgi:hypothetical protein
MSGAVHQWLQLRWPHEVKPEQLEAALLALNGLTTPKRRDAFALVTVGTTAGVTHYLAVPPERREAITDRLRQAIPGLAVDESEAPGVIWTTVWAVWMSTRTRPLRTSTVESQSAGLVTAMAHAGRDEGLALAWTIGPVRRPLAVPSKATRDLSEAWRRFDLTTDSTLDNEARTALMHKQGEPGWRAAGRLAVRAASRERERQLLQRLSGALRVAQGAGVQIGAHRLLVRGRLILPWRRPLALNVSELAAVAGWPVGDLEGLAIERTPARAVMVPRVVPRHGRIIGDGAYPGQERPVAITSRDSLSHMWFVGPTGSGKSTALTSLAEQDMADGRAVVALDPKGDLLQTILSRVPAHRREDVVVIDAADDCPVGLNPLKDAHRHPELVADVLFGLFRSLSGDAWGPRVGDVIHAALLTMAQQPDANLCALPALLTDAGYRRQLLQRLDDPFGLGPFWAAYEQLTAAAQQETIAPVMRRLRQLLLRPRMRAVLGQTTPKFELNQLLTERKIVLVSLAKGLLGPEASSLLGSLFVSQLWGVILGRVAVPPERRHPVMVYLDEVQDQVRGITDLDDMLVQARSLGASIHAAHQHLGQLEPTLRATLSANARTRVVFQTSHEDATFFARGQHILRPEDFQGLPRHQAFVSVLVDGHVTPYASVRMRPPSPACADPDDLRARSRQRYGVDRRAVDADLRRLIAPTKGAADATIGVRRRTT